MSQSLQQLGPLEDVNNSDVPALRDLSFRPELIVDQNGTFITAPNGGLLPFPFTQVGRQPIGNLGIGRQRLLYALPTNGSGPVQLEAPVVVHDAGLGFLADPQGNLIGVDGVWVGRMLSARWVGDTRGLAG